MKKRYYKMMDHVYPTTEQKNSMLEKAFELESESEVPKKHDFKLRYCIPALALCLVFSTTVFADEIKNTFYNILGKNEIIADEVLNDVYTDKDEHLTMSIKEVLSDKINSHVIVEYTMHDDIGREWIDNLTAAYTMNFLKLSPHLKEENTILYGISYGWGCEEKTEYRTENTRVFDAYYDGSGDEFGTDSVDLVYHMYNKWEKHAIIDISESVQLRDIKLDSSLAPDNYYKPLGVKISPMSIYIYGQNCGLYEAGYFESGGYYVRSLHDNVEIKSLYLIMKDGKKYDLLKDDTEVQYSPGWMLGSVTNAGVDYDCSIFCSALRNIDLNNVDGIRLDGVYYPLNL